MKYSISPDLSFRRRPEILAVAVAAIFVLLGIALRIALLAKYPDLWFDSDEANLGLMALHLLHHGKINLFIAGESYGGFLGVSFISLCMLVTRSPFIGIKAATLLFYVAFAGSIFILARQVFNRWVGVLAVALVSVSPSFLTLRTVNEKGPHAETLLLGTLLMIVTIHLSQTEQTDLRRWFLWGGLAGFCWYTYYLSVVFTVPCFLFLLWNRKFTGWKRNAAALAGILVGSLPYWVFAIRYEVLPPATKVSFFNPIQGFKNFFMVGLPVIAGARWSFSRADLVPVLSKSVVLLYGVVSVVFLISLVRSRTSRRDGRMLLAIHLLLYPLIFAFSSFGWFADEPRYLIGLYSSVVPVMSWFIYQTYGTSKALGIAILMMVLSLSAYGSLTTPPEIFNTIFAEPNGAVIEYLRRSRIRHFYANYWIVYRIMFESREELIGANYFDITYERYPAFRKAADDDPAPAYVAWESEAPGFESRLRSTGRTYQKTVIGRYVVFNNVSPRLAPVSRPPNSQNLR